MEVLWNLFLLLIVAGSIIGRIQKAARRQHAQQPPVKTGNPVPGSFVDPFHPASWGAFFEETRQEHVPATAPTAFPAALPSAYQEMSPSIEGLSSEASGFSWEGRDTYDPNLGHTDAPLGMPEQASLTGDTPTSSSAGTLPLSFTPDALMQGIIMSEVLTRPAQRKWARR